MRSSRPQTADSAGLAAARSSDATGDTGPAGLRPGAPAADSPQAGTGCSGPARPGSDGRLLWLAGAAAIVLGSSAAWFYHTAGLTLAHYDAKAHLVVARRVLDSRTPGLDQIGAVWLPLPHILNMLPVQIDAFYRSGASAVAISVLAFALAAVGAGRIVLGATRSPLAALTASSILALNPALLYLQSTPMTEPLLVALAVVATSFSWDWLENPTTRNRRRAGWTIAAACLTRYEAWPLSAALLAAALIVFLFRRRVPRRRALGEVARLASYPAATIALFLLESRLTVGQWFVSSGFFVPDNPDKGNMLMALGSVWWGVARICGRDVLVAAAACMVVVLTLAVCSRRHRSWLVFASLFAVAALPAYAFFEGHPFRVRYMTPLVAAVAVSVGLGLGLLPRWPRRAGVFAFGVLLLLHVHPFDLSAPMVLEAQWDSGNQAARRQVTRYLSQHYDGRPILASMGSLAHYMQELSSAGFDLRDFLHEGNGGAWDQALAAPDCCAGWVLVEEWAEGGDEIAARARRDPRYLQSFERVAEGGGVALYQSRSKSSRETSRGPGLLTSESSSRRFDACVARPYQNLTPKVAW